MTALVFAGLLLVIAAVIGAFAFILRIIIYIMWVREELHYEHLNDLQRQGKL